MILDRNIIQIVNASRAKIERPPIQVFMHAPLKV